MFWLCALGRPFPLSEPGVSVGKVRLIGDLETVGDFGGLNKRVLGVFGVQWEAKTKCFDLRYLLESLCQKPRRGLAGWTTAS